MGLRHVTPRVKRPTSMAVPLPSWAVGDTSQETDSANSIAVSHQSLLLVSMQCSESSVCFHAMFCLLLICIRLLCLLSGSALACLCCFKKKGGSHFFFFVAKSPFTQLLLDALLPALWAILTLSSSPFQLQIVLCPHLLIFQLLRHFPPPHPL